MARKFQTSDIVSPVKARFSKRSLTHINEAYDELSEASVKGMIGNYTTNDLVILHGCVVEVTGGSIPGTGTATLTAGAIYYNGRIYEVDANASLSTTNPQTLVWDIVETTISGDPATFDDGNTYDFHIIEKFALAAGSVGGGVNANADFDGSAIKYLAQPFKNVTATVDSSSNLSSISARFDGIKKGNVLKGVMRTSAIVTTGATASELIIQLPSSVDALTTLAGSGTDYPLVGMIHLTAGTLQPLVATYIGNGLNATDAWIGASGRLNIDIAGGVVADGATIVVIVDFTLMTAN